MSQCLLKCFIQSVNASINYSKAYYILIVTIAKYDMSNAQDFVYCNQQLREVVGASSSISLICFGFDHDRMVQSTKFGILVP